MNSEAPAKKLQFYVTGGYKCGYLPKKMAQNLVATPYNLVDTDIYSSLIQQGFRRSGENVYRPHCENCNACITTRIPVKDFQISRSQKRALKQHKNLTAHVMPIDFKQVHYDLYLAYQHARHQEATEDNDAFSNDVDTYKSFICQSNVDSILVEFREENVLKMVSIIDIIDDGISAVYTFYDTSNPKTSYGIYNVVWQIQWAEAMALKYVYLGYWVEGNAKMIYKSNFKPLEKLINGEWVV